MRFYVVGSKEQKAFTIVGGLIIVVFFVLTIIALFLGDDMYAPKSTVFCVIGVLDGIYLIESAHEELVINENGITKYFFFGKLKGKTRPWTPSAHEDRTRPRRGGSPPRP